jgi:hypothetical protein
VGVTTIAATRSARLHLDADMYAFMESPEWVWSTRYSKRSA